MNAAQTALYFREWGKVRRYYVEQGIDPKQVDAKRHELHKRALGAMKSSKAFTNADLDKVLAVFFTLTRPADLDAQLRQIDQPEQRAAAALRRAQDLAVGIAETSRENNYLRGIAGKVFGNPDIYRLSAEQLEQICGILRQRRAQIERRNRPAKKQAAGSLYSPYTPENCGSSDEGLTYRPPESGEPF